MESPEPIYRLKPTPVRRALGIALLAALGAFLIWLFFLGDGMEWAIRGFLGAAGLIALFGAERMRQATRLSVELWPDGLRDSAGRELAAMTAIRSVDRGAFAFKPSNGFLVRLDKTAPRGWAPGLWWRFGRSLGVGGVTNRDEAKLMADLLAQQLAERDAGGPS